MPTKPVSKKDILALINKDWKTRDQGYDLKKAALEARLKDLNTKFQEDKRPVSFQMSLEAGWLLNYTDDWPRLSAALDRLEASLAETASPLTPAAQCADGSWGPGCTEWYRKLEPTFSMLRLQD